MTLIKKSQYKYIAAIAFALLAVFEIIEMAVYRGGRFEIAVYISLILSFVAYTIISVGFFKSKRCMILVGCIVCIIGQMFPLVRFIYFRIRAGKFINSFLFPLLRWGKWNLSGFLADFRFFQAFALILCFTFLFVATLNKRIANYLCYIASSIYAFFFVKVCISLKAWGYHIPSIAFSDALPLVPSIIAIVAILFAGFDLHEPKISKQKPAVLAAASGSSTSGNIEKLTKLKSLLDMGAITQEEFDAKKKQILGL